MNNILNLYNCINDDNIKTSIDMLHNLIRCNLSLLNYDNNTKYLINKEFTNIFNNIADTENITKLDNLFKKIINNCYEYSGYQMVISNVPEYGNLRTDININTDINTNTDNNNGNGNGNGNDNEKIDIKIIYDTIEYYSKCGIMSVLQVYNDIYLVKFVVNNDDEIQSLCDLLNNNLIGKNIIQVKHIISPRNISQNISPQTILQNVLYILIKIKNYIYKYIY